MNEKDMIFGKYLSWKLNENTHFITAVNGTMYMYLLEGEEKALLIDTAYGAGELRNFVESLTSKPVIVVNTHGHLDHAGGNGWWEEVYMHKNAEVDLQTINQADFNLDRLPYVNYKKNFIEEGFVFKLGNRDIEVYDISAHSNGSLALLDKKNKLLFTGDEIESTQVLMHMPNHVVPSDLKDDIKRHLNNMIKLKNLETHFEYICPAHNGAPISKEYIDNFIELDNQILDGKQYISPSLKHFFIEQAPFAKQLKRAEYKNAAFIYGE